MFVNDYFGIKIDKEIKTVALPQLIVSKRGIVNNPEGIEPVTLLFSMIKKSISYA